MSRDRSVKNTHADHQGDEDGRRVEAAPGAAKRSANARPRTRIQMKRVLASAASPASIRTISPAADRARTRRAGFGKTLSVVVTGDKGLLRRLQHQHPRRPARRSCSRRAGPVRTRDLVGRQGPRLLRPPRLPLVAFELSRHLPQNLRRGRRGIAASRRSTCSRRARSIACGPDLQRIQIGHDPARGRGSAAADFKRRDGHERASKPTSRGVAWARDTCRSSIIY